ncbi:MAG: MerR family regulatory protein [Thermosediminibacterales bacterium]|nr:MerR family regulatory protein [Thermosediminibacterales bacterium]MDK2835696.1 MerR family regulatory protein [Thermosediminibacterales bacterium]
MNQKYYTTGEISEKLDVTKDTLYYWEKEFPDYLNIKRADNKRKERLWTDKNIEQLKVIIKLKNQGLTIKEIKDRLNPNPKDPFEKVAVSKEEVKMLNKEIQELKEVVKRLIEEEATTRNRLEFFEKDRDKLLVRALKKALKEEELKLTSSKDLGQKEKIGIIKKTVNSFKKLFKKEKLEIKVKPVNMKAKKQNKN